MFIRTHIESDPVENLLVVKKPNDGAGLVLDLLRKFRTSPTLSEYTESQSEDFQRRYEFAGLVLEKDEDGSIKSVEDVSNVFLSAAGTPIWTNYGFEMVVPEGVILETVDTPFIVVSIDPYCVDGTHFARSCFVQHVPFSFAPRGEYLQAYEVLFLLESLGIPKESCRFFYVDPFSDDYGFELDSYERIIMGRNGDEFTERAGLFRKSKDIWEKALNRIPSFGRSSWLDAMDAKLEDIYTEVDLGESLGSVDVRIDFK